MGLGGISIWQLLIVLAIVLLLFGRGKIPQLMGDMAKGIKSFKKGMSDDDKKEDIKSDFGQGTFKTIVCKLCSPFIFKSSLSFPK